MSNDGKTAGPEASAQREARSEHIPTPEGGGGEQKMADDELIERLQFLSYQLYDARFGRVRFDDATPEDAIKEIRRLRSLSSPRVEEVRRMREALERTTSALEAITHEHLQFSGYFEDVDMQAITLARNATSDARDVLTLSPPVG